MEDYGSIQGEISEYVEEEQELIPSGVEGKKSKVMDPLP